MVDRRGFSERNKLPFFWTPGLLHAKEAIFRADLPAHYINMFLENRKINSVILRSRLSPDLSLSLDRQGSFILPGIGPNPFTPTKATGGTLLFAHVIGMASTTPTSDMCFFIPFSETGCTFCHFKSHSLDYSRYLGVKWRRHYRPEPEFPLSRFVCLL